MNSFLITVAVKILMIAGGDNHNEKMEKHQAEKQTMSIEELAYSDTITKLKDCLQLPIKEIE
jgi:hypothetical protein